MKKNPSGSCESCENYIYDDETEQYYCMINLDEDEYGRFLSAATFECPYYRLCDDYKIVEKQN